MSTRPTEFRTVSDFRLQRDLERMREARNQRIAEREENYRRLLMPEPIQPGPVNFCAEPDADETNNARWELVLALIFAVLLTPLVAAFANWFLPIVWSWK